MRASVQELKRDTAQAHLDRDQIEASLARERSAREAMTLELGRERVANAPVSVPTLTLPPVTVKSPKGPETAVPSTTAPVVELRLVLPRGSATDRAFSVALRSWTTGEVLWTRAQLRAGSADGKPAILAPLTSDVLAPGQYEVQLTAGTPPTTVAVYEVAVVPSGGK
jgi:hypothetical protein